MVLGSDANKVSCTPRREVRLRSAHTPDPCIHLPAAGEADEASPKGPEFGDLPVYEAEICSNLSFLQAVGIPRGRMGNIAGCIRGWDAGLCNARLAEPTASGNGVSPNRSRMCESIVHDNASDRTDFYMGSRAGSSHPSGGRLEACIMRMEAHMPPTSEQPFRGVV